MKFTAGEVLDILVKDGCRYDIDSKEGFSCVRLDGWVDLECVANSLNARILAKDKTGGGAQFY